MAAVTLIRQAKAPASPSEDVIDPDGQRCGNRSIHVHVAGGRSPWQSAALFSQLFGADLRKDRSGFIFLNNKIR
jgi:hypothetical protein